MEIEDLLEKYRMSKPQIRYSALLVAGLLPAVYLWTNEGDSLSERLETTASEHATAQDAFEDAQKKVAELPALETKITEIEGELKKAREVLPDKIELDAILGFIGSLEKELNVKLVKFYPGVEQSGPAELEYKELPIDITLSGTFGDTMRFMDRLVHMQNLTHMRNIQFVSHDLTEDEKKSPPTGSRVLDSQAKLILFKGK